MTSKLRIFIFCLGGLSIIGMLVTLAYSYRLPQEAFTPTPAASRHLPLTTSDVETVVAYRRTLTPDSFTPIPTYPSETPGPTERPFSDAEVTIIITTPITELKVDDTLTVSAMLTNTGEIRVIDAGLSLNVYLEDGVSQTLSSLDPMITPAFLGNPIFDASFRPKDATTLDFTLSVLRVGTVNLVGVVEGKAEFSPHGMEYAVKWKSTPLTLHVWP